MIVRLLLTASMLVLAALACTINIDVPASRTGETRTLTLNEAPPGDGTTQVEIDMLGGELNISGGGSNLVSGQIEYNVAEWEPVITRTGDTVRIAQEAKTIPIPDEESIINRWNVQLGNTPMALSLRAGAYDGTINLSGVPLTELDISGGVSNSEVRFDLPNPQMMDNFKYQTGASNVELYGLGNAGPAMFTFQCGAGDYLIDFSGTPQREITADITGALGSMTVVVPPGANALVNLSGDLQDVNLEGDWTQENNRYSVPGSGPLITINITMTVGQLNLAIR